MDRLGERLRKRRKVHDVVVGTLAIPPAVVAAAGAGGLVVDFLPSGLADISDDHRAGSATPGIVKAESPRIAQTDRPDFRKDIAAPDEGIVARHYVAGRVGCVHRDVETQHLPEQAEGVLREVERVVPLVSVTDADKQIAVWPEDEVTSLVGAPGL